MSGNAEAFQWLTNNKGLMGNLKSQTKNALMSNFVFW